MYEPFFGLDRSPFGLTPDPRFLFRSRVHHEILSLLLYGVTTSKGVMLLLGDVGTGKTTLCRALLRELPAEAESVLLLNPHLSETELVGAILDDLGLERRGKTRAERETFRYVEHRLRAAGLGASLPFTWAATARIHRYSGGVPRVINLVCDRALSTAFAGRQRNVDVDTVKAAIRSLEGRPPLARQVGRIVVAAAVVAVAVAGITLGLGRTWRPGGFVPHASSSVLAATPTPAPAPAPGPEPSSAPVTATVAVPPPPPPTESLHPRRRLLAELIALWTLQAPPRSDIAAWPALADGVIDIARVADRYQLIATRLPRLTAAELRAIGLPALLELDGAQEPSVLLLRRIAGDTVTLVDGTGTELRYQLDELDSKLVRAEAWVLWRNLDQLPVNGARSMTPATVLTVALRLHKLGHLEMPIPHLYDARLVEAVRAFQRSTGLRDDGVLGPRTTLALSRVVASAVAPSIAGDPSR